MSREKTPTQKKRQYKAISRACFGGEFVSIFAPFVTIGIVNYDKYFIDYDGTKMSIAAILSLSLMGLATWLVAKKKFNNSFVTLIIGWATVDMVFYLMGTIINDITQIMFWGLFGLLGAYGLNIASEKTNEKAEEIQKGIDRAKEEMTAEAYKDEVARKVKVKVKK